MLPDMSAGLSKHLRLPAGSCYNYTVAPPRVNCGYPILLITGM